MRKKSILGCFSPRPGMAVRPRPLLAILAAAALTLAACGGGESTSGDGGGSQQGPLVVAVPTEPSTLDPQAVNDRSSRVLTYNIFDTLVGRNAQGEKVPALATSWSAVNDTTWEFELREGVTFHNGEPFNAEAAAFSINRIVDPDYATQRDSHIERVEGAEAVDETTLRVNTGEINAVLPTHISNIPMVPPEATQEGDLGQNPIGTGPYKFVEWNKGRDIRLERNEDYWGERTPSVQDVTIRMIPDKQTALSALQSGEVNLVLDLLPEQRELAPKVASFPGIEFSKIQYNAYYEPLTDPQVRIALNHAVNKEELARTVYQGMAKPMAAQYLTEPMIGYNPDVTKYEYDPERARQMLAEAGYPDGFPVTLHAPVERYLKGIESAQYVADALREVGIDVTLREWEWNQFREAGRIQEGEEGAMDMQYEWHDNSWFDAARSIGHVTCDDSSSKICDEEVTRLFEQALSTTDEQQRDQLYQQAWAGLHENPDALYLLQHHLIYGLSENVDMQPLRKDDQIDLRNVNFVSGN